ncbi:50S ribosomal protein L14 [Candidatus Dojkabacteria bacterium]|nr:50S ribosomal protein L14 [Candidatus Dojkabacteria bacterium]
MIQKGTVLKITDNTGARRAMVIGIPGSSSRRFASIGDVVRVTIVKAIPKGLSEEHSKEVAVIVRVSKEFRRKDGSYVRFDDNAGVILQSPGSKLPKGTRIFGPVARELKELGYDKIISLAPEVL